jgi:hypothetical protein
VAFFYSFAANFRDDEASADITVFVNKKGYIIVQMKPHLFQNGQMDDNIFTKSGIFSQDIRKFCTKWPVMLEKLVCFKRLDLASALLKTAKEGR